MAISRYRGKKRLVYLGPEIDGALVAFVDRTGEKVSDVIRRGVASAIGQPELAASVQMGRPKKPTDEQEEATAPVTSPRKKAVAATGKVVSAPKKAATRKRAAE